MNDYNTKIEELNKEMEANHKEALNCKKCQEPFILLCDFHSRIDERTDDLVKQLNELRNCAIEEVKELQEEKDAERQRVTTSIIVCKEGNEKDIFEEAKKSVIKFDSVIDYLKTKFNITNADFVNSKEEAINRIKELNKRFQELLATGNIGIEGKENIKEHEELQKKWNIEESEING